MEMYIEELIFPSEESKEEKNQTKENWMSKKNLSTFLMTEEKVQWEEVTLRHQGKRKTP